MIIWHLDKKEQHTRQGLGFTKTGKRVDQMSKKEYWNALSNLVQEISEEQGRWLSWETAMQMDIRWNKFLYSWSPEMLKFYLNTIQDTLPTPANLKIWNKQALGQCVLCGYNNCTMIHIFKCCQHSHRSGRYNLRYDTVLREIVHQIIPAILRARNAEIGDDRETCTCIAFKTEEGKKYKNVAWLGD